MASDLIARAICDHLHEEFKIEDPKIASYYLNSLKIKVMGEEIGIAHSDLERAIELYPSHIQAKKLLRMFNL